MFPYPRNIKRLRQTSMSNSNDSKISRDGKEEMQCNCGGHMKCYCKEERRNLKDLRNNSRNNSRERERQK